MDRKYVYCDWNVIKFFKDNINELQQFKEKHTDCEFIYSPAHLEDVAKTNRGKNGKSMEEMIQDDLNFLSKFTNDNEILPNGKIIKESPYECLKRVKDKYYLNEIVEPLNRNYLKEVCKSEAKPREVNNQDFCNDEMVEDIKKSIWNEFKNEFKINFKEVTLIKISTKQPKYIGCFYSTQPPQTIFDYFSEKQILKADYKFLLKHDLLKEYIQIAFDELEKRGYYRESIKKSNNRIYDIMHAMYSLICDCHLFVTNDNKLYKKIQVVYKILGKDINEIEYFKIMTSNTDSNKFQK